MQSVLAEAVGTMLLVLLGDGVVANVVLNRSKGQNSGWIRHHDRMGCRGRDVGVRGGTHQRRAPEPGGDDRPGGDRQLPWKEVPGYLAAQMVGGFAGAVLVWLAYLPHWSATEDAREQARRVRDGTGYSEPGGERDH
jgi:glycerol uptake facilitator protein